VARQRPQSQARKNIEPYLAMLTTLGSLEIRVGLAPEEGRELKKELKDGGSTEVINPDINVATAAYQNEYGAQKTPARPAFRQTARSHVVRRQIQKFEQRLKMMAAANGLTNSAVVTASTELGQALADSLREMLERWSQPPNAPRTIADKGFNKPLTATMQTQESISARVFLRKSLRAKLMAKA
jgi:phage-related protein